MGIIGAITHPVDTFERGVKAVSNGAEDLADKGKDAAGYVAQRGKAAAGYVAGRGAAAADYAADKALSLVPDDIHLAPKLPPYPTLSPAERARATLRGQGQTSPQPVITGSDGNPHEPVALYITGTRDELEDALEAKGWNKAVSLTRSSGFKTVVSMINRVTRTSKVVDLNYEQSPVSDMYLDGKKYVVAFNKNNQANLSRDHLRVFETGRKAPDGRPIWAIAATRDVAMHINPKEFKGHHEIDKAIDGERDLVMVDLLGSDMVEDWRITQGRSNPEVARHIAKDYQTDGKVYEVELAPKA